LTDITLGSGLDFRHSDGGCGQHLFAEQVGGGAAFFDFNNDGLLDLYLLSGASLPGCAPSSHPGSRLFRSLGNGRFADATLAAGLGDPGYATGAAAGDIDNDGDEDLFVSCFGPDRLYQNDGSKLTEIGRQAGIADPGFSASASFLDYDRDGYLDLYVAHYVSVDAKSEKRCSRQGLPVYCLPQDYPGESDHLYRNDRSGKFTDVTLEAGIDTPRARGLGVAAGDYDDDGNPDIFVANDTNENLLFHNNGNGTFTERAMIAGVALSEDGVMQNGMGADWGDFDGDGRLDLVVTNFDGQTNSLYRNLGNGFFLDVSYASGIGEPSLPYVGWAAIFADMDLDGRLDLFVTNGHVFENVAQFQEGACYAQPSLLHLNIGQGRFKTVSSTTAWRIPPKVSRGAAAGDFDNDGDVDLVINNLNSEPYLLRNDTPRAGHWLGLRLIGTKSNRSAIGARATLRAEGLIQVREVKSGSGYLSQNDLRLLFGLGSAAPIESLQIRWPSGLVEEVSKGVKIDQYSTIVEGKP
jgi:hypothetical protein